MIPVLPEREGKEYKFCDILSQADQLQLTGIILRRYDMAVSSVFFLTIQPDEIKIWRPGSIQPGDRALL